MAAVRGRRDIRGEGSYCRVSRGLPPSREESQTPVKVSDGNIRKKTRKIYNTTRVGKE